MNEANEAPAEALPAARSVAEHSPVTPMRLLEIATNQGADLDRLEKLMELQERWERNEARKSYNVAFAAFKAEAVTIIRNKRVDAGPLSGKRYAELHAAVEAATPALSRHGLSTSWKVTKDEKDWIEVTCELRHVMGHVETVALGGPPDSGGAKNPIQARASTLSYLERYTFLAITGLATKDQDDDAHSAGDEEETGLSDKQYVDFETAIDSSADHTKLLEELWPTIAKACKDAEDADAHTRLKAQVTAKVAALKKGASK
jgi:hypothetical protein